MLHDVDVYLDGINARLRRRARPRPSTRVDIFAVNALAGQIFGEGGGDEAAAPSSSTAAQAPGDASGHTLFDDLGERDDADTPATLTRAFPYAATRRRARATRVIDDGSLQPGGPRGARARGAARTPR